jgi:hypothetical protein
MRDVPMSAALAFTVLATMAAVWWLPVEELR